MVTRRSRDAMRAAAVLAVACCFDGPLRLAVSLPLVMASLAISCLALRNGDGADVRPFPPTLWMLLASVAALGIAMPGNIGPLWLEFLRRGFSFFGVVAIGLVSGNSPLWRRRALVASVAGATVLAFIIPGPFRTR